MHSWYKSNISSFVFFHGASEVACELPLPDQFSAWAIFSSFFFFNDTAPTEIYTLSLHDALPICRRDRRFGHAGGRRHHDSGRPPRRDRKSTRLNSSHVEISYAVFCLKKKKR